MPQYDQIATATRIRPASGANGYPSNIRRPHKYIGWRGPGTFVAIVSRFCWARTTARATTDASAWRNEIPRMEEQRGRIGLM